MPVAVPPLSSYQHVPETKEPLEWANLPTIDLSLYGTPEGNKLLADRLIDSVKNSGFFYVKGFPISQERVDRQFAIGQEFYELPFDVKKQYEPDLDAGQYVGYRPPGRRMRDPVSGLKDRIEMYNIPKFINEFKHNHPAPIAEHLAEIEHFTRDLHEKVFEPLLVLFAIALELPEDALTKLHTYNQTSSDHLRYMKYSKYTPEENARLGDVWFKGHTDLGTLSLLFRQPVAALQIQDAMTHEWRWVKPQDGTLTVNTGDALSFLTGGYVKSTVHRVAAPPKDQNHVDRLGVLYFTRPHDDVLLQTIEGSPVLQREGCTENVFEKLGRIPNMQGFTVSKQQWFQTQEVNQVGKVIVPGFTGKIHE